MGIILNNLAELYCHQGAYAKALPMYKNTRYIFERALGPKHPAVATCMENMAVVYRKTKKEKMAEFFEKKAAQIKAIHSHTNGLVTPCTDRPGGTGPATLI